MIPNRFKNFNTGFFLGSWLNCVVFSTVIANVDVSFDSVQKRHQKLIEVCESLGSKPKSYDIFEVTCENRVVVDYEAWGDDE